MDAATPTAAPTTPGAAPTEGGAAADTAAADANLNALAQGEASAEGAEAKTDPAATTKPPEQAAVEADAVKHKVTVDGNEMEVSLAELKRGYMRTSHFTKRTQEVAAREAEVERLESILPTYIERAPADVLVKIGGPAALERAIVDAHRHADPNVKAALDRALDRIVADAKRPAAEIELERIQRERQGLEQERQALEAEQRRRADAQGVKTAVAEIRGILERAITEAGLKVTPRTLARVSDNYKSLHRPGSGFSAVLAAEAVAQFKEDLALLGSEAAPPPPSPPPAPKTPQSEVDRVAAAKSAPPNGATPPRDESGRFTTPKPPGPIGMEQARELLRKQRSGG